MLRMPQQVLTSQAVVPVRTSLASPGLWDGVVLSAERRGGLKGRVIGISLDVVFGDERFTEGLDENQPSAHKTHDRTDGICIHGNSPRCGSGGFNIGSQKEQCNHTAQCQHRSTVHESAVAALAEESAECRQSASESRKEVEREQECKGKPTRYAEREIAECNLDWYHGELDDAKDT